MNITKSSTLFLILFLILSLTACQSKNNYNTDNQQDQQKNVQENRIKNFEPFSAITESEFNEYFKNEAVVIDIRTTLEISQGKISQNALEIDFYDKYFQQEILKLDNTKTYFIYCAHGNRTRKAKEIMQSIGFDNVYDLRDGIVNWKGELIK
jgi:rhodanese-related sulfurtransferase